MASNSGKESGQFNALSLFLSLFLLVLAFFIVLLSFSIFVEVKSNAVKGSLSSVFKTPDPLSTDTSKLTAKDGGVVAGQQFQEQITDIFATALKIAKIEIVQPGQLMRIKLPTKAIFVDDESAVRPLAVPLLDRIVAALSVRPAGFHFDMEFVIGSPYVEGKSLPVGQTLEVGRVGNLAREMFRRGVPPDSVAVGIRPGRKDQVTIWFFVRQESEDKPRLRVPEGKNGAA